VHLSKNEGEENLERSFSRTEFEGGEKVGGARKNKEESARKDVFLF